MVALKLVLGEDVVAPSVRSRNAVVALKPHHRFDQARDRRGKQERRGGIETAIPAAGARHQILEAGTPWWH